MKKLICMIAWMLILSPMSVLFLEVMMPSLLVRAQTTSPPHCCQCSIEFLACEGTEAIRVTKEQECGNVFSEEECTEDCVIQPETGIAEGCKFMENSHCALYRRGTGVPGEFELFSKCVPGSATPVQEGPPGGS